MEENNNNRANRQNIFYRIKRKWNKWWRDYDDYCMWYAGSAPAYNDCEEERMRKRFIKN